MFNIPLSHPCLVQASVVTPLPPPLTLHPPTPPHTPHTPHSCACLHMGFGTLVDHCCLMPQQGCLVCRLNGLPHLLLPPLELVVFSACRRRQLVAICPAPLLRCSRMPRRPQALTAGPTDCVCAPAAHNDALDPPVAILVFQPEPEAWQVPVKPVLAGVCWRRQAAWASDWWRQWRRRQGLLLLQARGRVTATARGARRLVHTAHQAGEAPGEQGLGWTRAQRVQRP